MESSDGLASDAAGYDEEVGMDVRDGLGLSLDWGPSEG